MRRLPSLCSRSATRSLETFSDVQRRKQPGAGPAPHLAHAKQTLNLLGEVDGIRERAPWRTQTNQLAPTSPFRCSLAVPFRRIPWR
jgi:hypothetical protein